MNKYYHEYPYIDGEQREFGWSTSKIIRPLKSKIGHIRRGTAEKFYESGKKSIIDNRNANELVTSRVNNKSLRNSILKYEAPKANATVSYKNKDLAQAGGGGATVYRDNVKSGFGEFTRDFPRDENIRLIKRMLKKDGRTGVSVSNDAGVEYLVHELGHAQGRVAKGKRRLISEADPRRLVKGKTYEGSLSYFDEKSREGIMSSGGKKVGFKESVKDLLNNSRNSRAIIAEEDAATKAGLEMLKRHGATPEELKLAARNLEVSGDTYRHARKASLKSSLGRIIDIPSRRGNKVILM